MAQDAAVPGQAADERAEAPFPAFQAFQAFLRDGRLVRLPAKLTRRKEVLRQLATRDFRPGARYTEGQVNDVLRNWCEGTETDHVSVRRYLVDYGILDRDSGDYWLLGGWLLATRE
jgi:hypothetical protein